MIIILRALHISFCFLPNLRHNFYFDYVMCTQVAKTHVEVS